MALKANKIKVNITFDSVKLIFFNGKSIWDIDDFRNKIERTC